MYRIVLKIDGMMCGMCEAHMNDVIRKNFDVKKVSSSAKKGETTIVSNEELDIEKAQKAILEIGYQLIESNSEIIQNNSRGLFRFGKK